MNLEPRLLAHLATTGQGELPAGLEMEIIEHNINTSELPPSPKGLRSIFSHDRTIPNPIFPPIGLGEHRLQWLPA